MAGWRLEDAGSALGRNHSPGRAASTSKRERPRGSRLPDVNPQHPTRSTSTLVLASKAPRVRRSSAAPWCTRRAIRPVGSSRAWTTVADHQQIGRRAVEASVAEPLGQQHLFARDFVLPALGRDVLHESVPDLDTAGDIVLDAGRDAVLMGRDRAIPRDDRPFTRPYSRHAVRLTHRWIRVQHFNCAWTQMADFESYISL